jgi:hypothetical protein
MPQMFPYGKPVKLLVDLQGYPDGRLIYFEIWQKENGSENKISDVFGVTRDNKGIGFWTPDTSQESPRKEEKILQKNVSHTTTKCSFYFICKIDDKEIKSEEFTFSYKLNIFLTDEAQTPIDGAKYTIKLSDKKEITGTVKNGHIIVEQAPAGKFTLSLKNYEFKELS